MSQVGFTFGIFIIHLGGQSEEDFKALAAAADADMYRVKKMGNK